MRLLVLTPEYGDAKGGIATFYGQLAPALKNVGVQIHVIEGSAYRTETDASLRTVDGVAVQTLERHRLDSWWSRFARFSATPRLRRHLAAAWAMWEQVQFGEGADVVEGCDWGLLFLPPAVEASNALIVQCHGSIGQIAVHDPIEGGGVERVVVSLLERAILSVAQSLQTLSVDNAMFWRGEIGVEPAVIRPAMEPPPLQATEPPSGHGLVVGRLQKWKGPHILSEALLRLGTNAPIVDWIGRDMPWDTRDQLGSARLAKDFPDIFGSRLVYRGSIPRPEVASRQASALFNLVPSTWDVFNFTVVEAMASGRPTIVSAGAGASELVEDGANGFIFPAGDADGLAAILDHVLSLGPARMSEIGRCAYETVRAALEPQTIAIQRIQAYRNAIEGFSTRQGTRIGGWLGDICRPAPRNGDELAFLDDFSLRELMRYGVKRAGRRVWRR